MKLKKLNISTRTKEYLKNGFGSIISNNAAIESAKSFPWWVAIILFLVSSFLPVIPNMVSISNTQGSSIISNNPNYSMDRYLIGSIITLNQPESTCELKIVKNNGQNELAATACTDMSTVEDSFCNYTNKATANEYYGLRMYWCSSDNNSIITEKWTAITSAKYIKGTKTLVPSEEVVETGSYYTPSAVLFTPIGFKVVSYKNQSTTAALTYTGDYVSYAEGTEIISSLGKVGELAIPTSIDVASEEYTKGVYDNLVNFFNLGYANIKHNSLVIYTFIYWGVYAALELFLGLLMFLLTRGKKNFNNYLKWYTCMFISFWASFTPALLGLILGFLLPQYSVVFFILFVGMRAMWLSMKQLAPTYQSK